VCCLLRRAGSPARSSGRPWPGLLGYHARHRTRHASLITEIDSLLAVRNSAPPLAGPRGPLEPLSNTEIRVMRYLPTNLTGPEIARELSVSRNTVKTHIRNLTPPIVTGVVGCSVLQSPVLPVLPTVQRRPARSAAGRRRAGRTAECRPVSIRTLVTSRGGPAAIRQPPARPARLTSSADGPRPPGR
jgi:DNA-binding CsgD family transcriptional regulator